MAGPQPMCLAARQGLWLIHAPLTHAHARRCWRTPLHLPAHLGSHQQRTLTCGSNAPPGAIVPHNLQTLINCPPFDKQDTILISCQPIVKPDRAAARECAQLATKGMRKTSKK
uniref:Uncharacterized protein n=1 Tax=Chlamydomonas leiostraca TaxID=1034604 RepID=A0A7S0RKA1_9CHLO